MNLRTLAGLLVIAGLMIACGGVADAPIKTSIEPTPDTEAATEAAAVETEPLAEATVDYARKNEPDVNQRMPAMTCEALLNESGQIGPELAIVMHTDLAIDLLKGGAFGDEEPLQLTQNERDAMIESLESLIDDDGMFCGLVEANPEDWR